MPEVCSALTPIADAAATRAALGLAINTDVQAYSANLAEYAAVNPTAAGLALLDDADAATQRVTLGLAKSSRGMIHGLTLSNNVTDATNDLDIAVGVAWDNVNDVLLDLTSGLTKRLDANWSVGTNQGGLDTGSKANSTTYHVWLVMRSDTGVVDVLFSTHATAPTMPSNYDRKRRIGSIMTDGSGVIRPFKQDGDRFTLTTTVVIYNGLTSPPTTATSIAIVSPLGIVCEALVSFAVLTTSGLKKYSLKQTIDDQTLDVYSDTTTKPDFDHIRLLTNTSSQIQHVANSAANILCYLNCNGWIDRRGQDG